MNYVFKKEKGEVDAWVAEMDEVAMEQAIGEAAKAVKRKAAEREEQDRRDAMREFKTAIQLKKELIALMQPKETVAGAMRRLSGKGGKFHVLLFLRVKIIIANHSKCILTVYLLRRTTFPQINPRLGKVLESCVAVPHPKLPKMTNRPNRLCN